MIFLKRIEAFGFKSFADPIKLDFEFGMTGVVGPNGSGKSNINDAIRWVLGEQSSKSLRGDNMEDIVFSGSEGKSPLNVAEVTVIFDNSKKIFSSLEFEEVSITRKFFKVTKESEYYINNSRVRLKDIQDIALETGLTKSSLAIISQGSVNNFVEAKPDERRKLFDEAAGVSKYKKRKEEAIRKLSRTHENLDRLNDIINEIERKLPNLKRQAENALTYKDKFEELKKIEVSILIKDINLYKERIEVLNEERNSLQSEISLLSKAIEIDTVEYHALSNNNYENEKLLSNLNQEFTNIVDKIGDLKVKKISLESKKDKVVVDGKQHRISQLEVESKEINIKLKLEQEKFDKLLNDNSEKRNLIDTMSNDVNASNLRLDSIRKQIAIIESQVNSMIQHQKNNDNLFEGVKNVLQNKNVLPGIIATVQNLIEVPEEYEVPITALIKSALQNIVAKNTDSVKAAINFLKSNKAGYATFLPLDSLKVNFISDENKFIIQNARGFVGIGSDLVKTKKEYKTIKHFLLGTSIVVNNYDDAVELSKLINYKFNIVTLEGEKILPHGAIVGGVNKNKNDSFSDEVKIKKLEAAKADFEVEEKKLKEDLNVSSRKIEIIREEVSEIQSGIGGTKQSIVLLQQDLETVKEEYRILTGKDINGSEANIDSVDEQILKIAEEIKKSELQKDEIQNEMNTLRTVREKTNEKHSNLSQSINEKRRVISGLKEKSSSTQNDINLLREKLSNTSERLAQDYNLTVDAAQEIEQVAIDNEELIREKIILLRSQIKSLGNVNLDSIEEYNQENSRYENYVEQTNDILGSINNLKKAIEEMDHTMLSQFTKTIKEVNLALPETFRTLFGGGEAKVIYTDPDDLLNSGIDIKVKPPGKKIDNLNLLSGGEKSLVALAVLFSILKARPLPLVILDEVEAPLDVANVERFAKYLKSFTNKTQFIVVTHRVGTMENCEVLFGATMEQKGITKIVKLKLIEAKELAEAS